MITTSRFLGYDKNEYGDLIVNRKEAEIVSLTFDLYLLNVGSSRIGELLDYTTLFCRLDIHPEIFLYLALTDIVIQHLRAQ